MSLEQRIIALSQQYRPLAVELLREVIRIPADYVDRDPKDGGDPNCGLSNHEGPRLEYLKRRIVEIGAVASPDDVAFDTFGNLRWVVEGDDDTPTDKRAVVFLDGHSDTVSALRSSWLPTTGGVDAYDGLVNADQLNRNYLADELGFLPPDDEWDHLVWGRGAADQLSGVICQVVATKILNELRGEGALDGVTVVSYVTVAEEDNDGAGPMHVMRNDLRDAKPRQIPDVVLLTEGTGDSQDGACAIYRGQRGRMQIEVTVTGRSCHGSMPDEGLNPLEYGGAILAEAADRNATGDGFVTHDFLGRGTRTASWSKLETPSDCAVPLRFVFRFDRRLTVGETPEQSVADIDNLPSVSQARSAGLQVDVTIPMYTTPTWRGTPTNNEQVYLGWITPEEHPAIQAALSAYQQVVSPQVSQPGSHGMLRKEPRVGRWIFSSDGVGYPLPADSPGMQVPDSKKWVRSGAYVHPAIVGFGPGIEQNTHKIGECVDVRELACAIALIARFPSLYAAQKREQ
jgi:putative selenium metabolism hydrolase